MKKGEETVVIFANMFIDATLYAWNRSMNEFQRTLRSNRVFRLVNQRTNNGRFEQTICVEFSTRTGTHIDQG